MLFFSDSYRAIFFFQSRFFSVVLVLLTANANSTEWQFEIIADQDFDAILTDGIIFNHVTKSLLPKNFINADFLVRFPKCEMNVSAEFGAFINKLAPLWDSSSWQSHPGYSTKSRRIYSTFDRDWPPHQNENEFTLAEKDLEAFCIHTSSFLNTHDAAAQARNRKPRAAPLAMMALASVGLFGSGIALVTGKCGLRGILGSYHDHSEQDAAKIEKLAKFTESLTQDVFKLRNEVND